MPGENEKLGFQGVLDALSLEARGVVYAGAHRGERQRSHGAGGFRIDLAGTVHAGLRARRRGVATVGRRRVASGRRGR